MDQHHGIYKLYTFSTIFIVRSMENLFTLGSAMLTLLAKLLRSCEQ